MNVEPIACLRDNYAYLLWQPGANDAVVADPSECAPVIANLQARQLKLTGILCTHHHWDHIGAVAELKRTLPNIPVFCSDHDREQIPEADQFLRDEQLFDCAGIQFKALRVPGHTLGAVAYLAEDCVFTGDTLFGAGCGRLFEGTAEQMHTSLMRLAALSSSTRIYFGHEYTKANLSFSLAIDPSNAHVVERERNLSVGTGVSTPSTIQLERDTNPFLRCSSAAIRRHLGAEFAAASDVEVFAELRRQKDSFR